MDTKPVTLECETNIDDIVAWNYYYTQNGRQWKKTWKIIRFVYLPLMVLCFFTGIILLITSITLTLGGNTVFISILPCLFGAAGFVYYYFYPKIIKSNLRKTVRKAFSEGKNSVIGMHKYTFTAEGIHESGELSEGTIKWQAVEKLVQDEKYLFIIIRPNAACIIPKRVFPDEAAFNSFVQNVNELYRAAPKIS